MFENQLVGAVDAVSLMSSGGFVELNEWCRL